MKTLTAKFQTKGDLMNAGSPVPVGTLPICSFIKAALFSSLWKNDMHLDLET
jgi:hypothetical protein